MMKVSTRERERLGREQEMLKTAIKLFCKNGFEKTSMEDLAKESGYTKKTIYRYFTCKEDLFFAVILECHKILLNMIMFSQSSDCNGLENIRRAYSAFYDLYCKSPQLLRLMTMVGIIKSYSENKDVPFKSKLDASTIKMFKIIVNIFINAKNDGSIRSDLDTTQLAYSSIFIVTSFFNLFSLSGNAFSQFHKMEEELFVNFCIDRLIDFCC